MSQFLNEFKKFLREFIDELYEYSYDDNVKKFIDSFEKLNMRKLIIRYDKVIDEYRPQFSTQNELQIDHKFMVFPGIDLNNYWSQLNSKQKHNIKVLLHKLNIVTEILMKEENQTNYKPQKVEDTSKDTTVSSTLSTSSVPFNPYIGVQGSSSGFSVSNIIDDKVKLPEKKSADSGGLLGLNIGDLGSKLQNLDEKDITEASGKIKGLLGNNVDPAVTDMISNILHNIGAELKNVDMSKGNIFNNITKVAENVAQKVMPELNKDHTKVEKLLASTQSIANGLATETGIDSNMMQGVFNSMQQMVPTSPEVHEQKNTRIPISNKESIQSSTNNKQSQTNKVETECISSSDFQPIDVSKIKSKQRKNKNHKKV